MGELHSEPNPEDPAEAFVDRVIKAIGSEFADDELVPRFTVVVDMPPDGRIGIASTGDNAPDIHRMLALGAGSVRRAMTPDELREARHRWTELADLFERRN